MPFYSEVLNTSKYEVVAISASVDTIPSGTAVKVNALPTGSITPYSYFQVSKASSTDVVFGVVAENLLTDTNFGRVILLNSCLIPVLMDEALFKGTKIKVTTIDGKFGEVQSGEIDHHFENGTYNAEELTLQPGEWVTLAAKSTTGNPSYVVGSINTREDQ